MIDARIRAARAKAQPLAECLLALAPIQTDQTEQQSIDRQAGAFVLAETIQLWRRSVTK